MEKEFDIILDECLELVMKGESIESVLAEFPDLRENLEPLLLTALDINHLPKIEPSPEYISTSKLSLLRKIQSYESEKSSGFDILSIFRRFSTSIGDFRQTFSAHPKWSVAVTAVLVIVLFATIGQSVLFKSSPAMASTCVLQILSGEVNISDADSDMFEPGSDGMVLETGAQVKTDSNSYALLTFNDGSTIKLEPETVLEINNLETNEAGSPVIVLSQLVGTTWSSVVSMMDPNSKFEIETPTATAVVHGTLFTTQVTEEGETTVITTEGLVSVTADDEEVFVAANQQTNVSKGKKPSEPQNIPEPESEISITIAGLAAGSLVDPTGSSTGKLPDGTEFNQIAGSQSSMIDANTQVITLSNPKNGNYKIALRYLSEDPVSYSIEGKIQGKVVLEYKDSLDPENEQNYILDFNLKVTPDSIEIGKFMVKPMGGNSPEKIVKDQKIPPGKNISDHATDKNKEDKEIPPGKNVSDNATSENNKENKPEQTGENTNQGKSDNITSSANQSNKQNQSQKDKEKDKDK